MADGCNNRAQVYYLRGTDDFQHLYTLDDDFDMAIDVDATVIHNWDNPAEDFAEFAVVDWGHSQVKLYSYEGVFKRTLFSQGSGVNQLDRPTSVCYGRDRVTHYPAHWIYVADNGNKRVIFKKLSDGDVWLTTPPGTFPDDVDLATVTVDAFGYVYALDYLGGKVYMLSTDLQELIAVFGSCGTDDGQLYYPNRFTVTEGWQYNGEDERALPLVIGDAVVTEFFGPETGVRRYVLGGDVLAVEPSYQPKPFNNDYCYDYVRCDWYQTGVTESWRTVTRGLDPDHMNDTLINVHETLNLPGYNTQRYQLDETDDNSFFYRFTVHVRSKYVHSISWFPPPIDTVFALDTTFATEYFLMERYYDTTCSPTQRFKCSGCGDTNMVYGTMACSDIVDLERMQTQSGCIYWVPNKWWAASAPELCSYDTAHCTPYYTWGGQIFYEDTLFSEGLAHLTTSKDTVYFMLGPPEYPFPYIKIATVRLSFDPETPYWEGAFSDTADIYRHVYPTYCYTECTTCVASSCPVLYSWDGKEWELVNNILPQSEERLAVSVDKIDVYPIYQPVLTDRDSYRLLIREDDNEVSYFDQFGLVALDVPVTKANLRHVNEQSLVSLTDKRTPPSSALTDQGENVIGRLVAEDGYVFTSENPGYLDIEYAFGKTSSTLSLGDQVDPGDIGLADPDKDVLTKLAVGADTGWVPNIYTVSVWNADGELVPVEKIYPRKRAGEHLVDLSDRSVDGVLRIRLEWTRRITLDVLPYIHAEKLEPVVTRLPLVNAVHSTDGAVTSSLSRLTADRVVLKPGEQIELTYQAQPPPDSMVRVLAFIAKGKYETMTDLADTAAVETVDGLTLDQNYPNPFNPTTTFSFALPQAADVKLEVYNVLGMKVATLVDGWLEAGRHAREWSGRNADGQLVASGVYFARLTAGEFTATKKMVVVK